MAVAVHEATDAVRGRTRPLAKTAALLMALSLAGSLATIPFSRTLLQDSKIEGLTPAVLNLALVLLVLVESFFSASAIGLGLWLGSHVGLGAPLIEGWLSGEREAPSKIRRSLPTALLVGLALGFSVKLLARVLDPVMPEPNLRLTTPSAWEGLLASLGAGIREEVWMRLGVMTVLVWAGTRLLRLPRPNAAMLWSANILAALIFSAIHLPQAATMMGLTTPVVAFVFVGNSVPGIAFGWFYERRGLIAAMAAHGAADFFLKVVGPWMG